MVIGIELLDGKILDVVRRVDEESIESDVFLESRRDSVGEGVLICGNTRGLVRLARVILDVAAKGFEGAHQHFDEAGGLDVCEVAVTIVLKRAEWDEDRAG